MTKYQRVWLTESCLILIMVEKCSLETDVSHMEHY